MTSEQNINTNSTELVLTNNESKSFSDALEYAKQWCSENQLAVGVGEMAIGAGLIAWGVHNGTIEMGTKLVATQIGGANIESIVGAIGGIGTGAVAGSILGAIGVAGMGSAIGIPAALIIGGSSAVFGMAGYTVGDIVHNIANPALDFSTFAANGSVLLVGVALIVDGARRCINDAKVLSLLSGFNEKVIYLKVVSLKVVARTMNELHGYFEEFKKLPEDTVDASFAAGSVATGASVGLTAGSAVAVSSVTVLGSSTLGGVALSLGIVSAPLWPLISGVAGGAGLGYAAYKAVKYWGGRKTNICKVKAIPYRDSIS